MNCTTNWNTSSGSLDSLGKIVDSLEEVKGFLVDGLKSPTILTPTNGSCEITFTIEPELIITSVSVFGQSRTCELYYDNQYEATIKSTLETIEGITFPYGFLDYEGKSKKAKKISFKFFSLIDKQNFSLYKIVFEKGQASQAPPENQPLNPLGMVGSDPKDMMMMMNLLSTMSMGPGMPVMPPSTMLPPMPSPVPPKPTAEEPKPNVDKMQEMIDKSLVAMEARLSQLIEKKFEDLKLYIDTKFQENK